jgi:2,5-diamino-6-(ribosylamino)-4(3H)-pyrimidinone 5'-phosphate reductase
MTLPVTTLFMLMSLDGKISTGASDERDFDKDLPNVPGVAEGLEQYYQLETTTDRFSLNTGRVLAKVGWNDTKTNIQRLPVSFVVVDNAHLTPLGVQNLLDRTERLIVVTGNSRHPAIQVDDARLDLLQADTEIDWRRVFGQLSDMGVRNLTVQSGGTLNATLARAGLINYLSVVIAPVLVGGRSTPSLLNGDSLDGEDDLHLLRPLRLLSVRELYSSYLHLRYAVAPSVESW